MPAALGAGQQNVSNSLNVFLAFPVSSHISLQVFLVFEMA